MSPDLAVLIVGYQRPENIRDILIICEKAGIKHILISVDAPRASNLDASSRTMQISQIFESFAPRFASAHYRLFDTNVGCSANLLSSCDWAFDLFEEVAVIEDDCIPSISFFDFCEVASQEMSRNKSAVLACGSQFIPETMASKPAFLSKYALTWGWFTSRENWLLLRQHLVQNSNIASGNFLNFDFEKVYWQEGARRAYAGYVDVWDTALVAILNQEPLYAIATSVNLVSNVGNDNVATHTGNEKIWTHRKLGEFHIASTESLQPDPDADRWLRDNFYKISFRHLISTRVTRILDALRSPMREPLLVRWARAIETR